MAATGIQPQSDSATVIAEGCDGGVRGLQVPFVASQEVASQAGLGILGGLAMSSEPDGARWRELEPKAHQPIVQEEIKKEIRQGTIRVVPAALLRAATPRCPFPAVT
jgi:hypothetical protein